MSKDRIKKAPNKNTKRLKRLLFGLLAVAFWIGVWWLISLWVSEDWILPSPYRVAVALFESLREGTLFLRAGRSLLGILEGYLAGMILGVVLAALTAKIHFFHILFSPLLTVVRATPVASFILILWVFCARGTVPAVSVMLIVLPIVWANFETGILSVDQKLFEVAKVYRFSAFKKMRFLYAPAVYPYFRTAALTAVGMAWKAGVAAEVLCTPGGTIGQMIWYAKRDIQTADLFAWTAVVIFVSFLLEKLLYLLLNLPAKRRDVKK